MAFEGAELLRPFGKTIWDAVRFYHSHLQARAASKPLDAFIKEYEAEMGARVAAGALRSGALKAIKGTYRFQNPSQHIVGDLGPSLDQLEMVGNIGAPIESYTCRGQTKTQSEVTLS